MASPSVDNRYGMMTIKCLQPRPQMLDNPARTAPTLFMLMAQHNGRTVVPIDQVCRDFFGHLTVEKLLRKARRGDLPLPIVRIETSQKARRGVHLADLAAYIDKRRAAAVKERDQLCWYDLGTTGVHHGHLLGHITATNRALPIAAAPSSKLEFFRAGDLFAQCPLYPQ